MKIKQNGIILNPVQQYGRRFALLLLALLFLAACSRNTPAPTSTPVSVLPTVASEAAGTPEAAPSAPESPLVQPDSPLTVDPTPAPSWPKSEEEALALAEQTIVPEPLEGMGAIAGVIYSFGTEQAVYGTSFYLTAADEIDGEFVPPELYFGPQGEEGDVPGKTNMLGQFELNNVPPGNYYLMLWTVYSYLSTYSGRDASAPLLITIEEGDQLDLGVVYANWP